MAKEITHILIAQEVLECLKKDGQKRLARVLEEHRRIFLDGTLIPDAAYYDLPPFCLNPNKHRWLSRELHADALGSNDQKAMRFFSAIAVRPTDWKRKVAFASGIVTHTAVDRIFHKTINDYTAAWGETGNVALATHREIETLIDMVLLADLGMAPQAFLRQYLSGPLGDSPAGLFQFYGSLLRKDKAICDRRLRRVLTAACSQQRFFLRLFAVRQIRVTLRLLNRLAKGRLQAWNALFYPDDKDGRHVPVVGKLGFSHLAVDGPFFEEVARLREAAARTAVKNIRRALITYG
jgi:hypothetical protein